MLLMIFVSYSHADKPWRKRFETISKPLSRAESLQFWSDKNMRAGEWEKQIETAMAKAVAAVLLDEPAGVSTFKAVEQLGLKLQPRHAPIDVMVIDSIMRTPTPN